MSILKRVAPAIALLAIFIAQPPIAQSAPIENNTSAVSITKPYAHRCNNKIVKWLYAAGFRGQQLRIGYAIVMRESGGDPRNITNGADYGLWQINRPTHPGYSRAALLDPISNSRIAYKLSRGGKSWRPWGIGVTRSGKVYMDSRDYDGIWDSWRKDHWIWIPFWRYYNRYPC